MSDGAVAAGILEQASGARRLLIARGLDPRIRAAVTAAFDERTGSLEELPCVRGEVVLPTDLTRSDVVVVGHPNWFGRFDAIPIHARSVAVVETRLGAHRPQPATATIHLGPAGTPETAERSRRRAERLARRLGQLPGVVAAYGMPVSGVFVALTPADPSAVAELLPGPAEPVAGWYPELPGGLRVDATGVAETDAASYAAAMENAVRSARG